MRKARPFVPLLLLIILCTTLVCAHSGRTDGNGGHYNRFTGEYHYHHGKPAHQHENGVCPYDKKESKPAAKPAEKSAAKSESSLSVSDKWETNEDSAAAVSKAIACIAGPSLLGIAAWLYNNRNKE